MTLKCSYRSRCNTIVLLMLLHIGQKFYGSEASVQFDHPTVDNELNLSEAHQNKMKQVDLPTDQKLIVRLPSNTLLKYTSYKDVSILHFRVPSDSRAAYFTFKATEESKSSFQRKCKAKDVTLHLKANSLPVISPENITFPNNFVNSEQRFKVYNLQFQSDAQEHRIHIQGPQLGSWFAVAFISWTDPNNDRIEQQGLSASCDTVLLGELSVSRFSPTIVNDGQVETGNLTGTFSSTEKQRLKNINNTKKIHPTKIKQSQKRQQQLNVEIKNVTRIQNDPLSRLEIDELSSPDKVNEMIYKFYVPEDVGVATALITFQEVCENCPEIGFYTQANAFPPMDGVDQSVEGNELNYVHRPHIKPNQTEEIAVEFYVQPNTWHYALLKFVRPPNTGEEDAVDLQPVKRLRQENGKDEKDYNVAYTLCILYKEMEPLNKSTKTLGQPAKLSETENAWQPKRFRGMDFYPLLRQSYHEFFMFDYDLVPDANGTVPALLNLTAQSAVGFAFELGEVYDTGGTLTFALSMKHDLRFRSELKAAPTTSPSERGGILAEKLVSDQEDGAGLPIAKDQLSKLAQGNQSMQIIVCMHHGVPGVPTWPDKCRYGQRLMPATSLVNNTDATGLIHVPFPESGLWYVTMRVYCPEADTARATIIDSVKEFVRTHSDLLLEMRSPCACAGNAERYEKCIKSKDCLAGMNETDTLKVKECIMDYKCTDDYLKMTHLFQIHHKSATEQHFADNCSTSVIFSVASSPCVAGRCGRFGRCYNYMSGGFVFSTCVCMKGYRGWDCTEDSQVPSSMSILLATLLLTLSNLLFIPSIYLAIKRRYFTEGIIYFFAMFFSIFYHACDSGEDEYSFCLVKIGVLQFCDFYCGLLAIWVTLIAMAHVPQQFVSLLHMFGAILLAFGTELNKQSLWVFLAPALTGICLISVSWGLKCSKTRKCFPARHYLIIFMPLGMVLVMVGLVCYAFLQTKQNYHIVHSIWHMVMAMSIMCLLPAPQSFVPKG
ncbi:uncharacterized protein LOC6564405 [Drosophila grimshawi]|uniref:GH18055 n=1 Tax=Drosophila grimshawi TaxID=7222 RepID=B4JHN2_DROGR|nr:uncharacterized protein LOC6564405 [Drosophila grimshawi]EDV93871.1 GH18055 [Drosophila grimshawi]